MRLSTESRRIRWLVLGLAWLVAATAIGIHAWETRAYLDLVGRAGLRGASEASTPLRQPVLSFAADAQTWIRYALQLDEGHSLRLRYTHLDNAPVGREVHWNSAWAWLIAGAGKFRQELTHEPLGLATERAALWLNPVVFLALIALFSHWASRRAGAMAGVGVALGMVGSARFFEGFTPGYVDHHGLLTAAVFGVILGVVFMGAGWWQPGEADGVRLIPDSSKAVRSAAIFSAFCGALGLWVSAASVVPAIAIAGIGAVAVSIARGRTAAAGGALFDPAAWRLWGRFGAVLSVGFYLLEYAPSHFGMRLEANHPLYALAWLGGGELVAELGDAWVRRRAPNGVFWLRLTWASVAVAAVPITIRLGGARVFMLRDPFMAALHHRIFEFMSLPVRLHLFGWRDVVSALNLESIPIVAGIALLVWLRRHASLILWYAVGTAAAFLAMGFWQERWLLNSSGPMLCLALVILAVMATRGGWMGHPATLVVLAGALYLPPDATRIIQVHRFLAGKAIDAKDALQPLFRDVAAALRNSQPKGQIVLLSSPNSSTGVGYYGRFETIGTLYWENDAGLKTAAEIFSAQNDDDAAALIRAHGITHIAMISEENFLAPYFELLHPKAPPDAVKRTFGYRLMVTRQIPAWLEILPYSVPPELRGLGVTVLLYKVNFGQTVEDAMYHLAMAQVAQGQANAAVQTANEIVKRLPNDPQSWVRRAEVLIAERHWDDAIAPANVGIMLAPRREQQRICFAVAKLFSGGGAAPYAAQMYRRGLTYGFDPEAAVNLAWILATSPDDTVRNGAQALQLVQRVVSTDRTSIAALDCEAAAFAECGRFSEAVNVVETALKLAGSDLEKAAELQKRLAAYRANRPWRQ
ncbi:MAG TPA: hypothetical protein VHE61_15285 [Opitutaceae bacterium]|nr:hypothetical protein [Opitutaceae bacterium]